VTEPVGYRVWTIPNLLSFIRLLGVPLLLWLMLGPEEDGWAFAVLAFSAFSDWADGKLARLLNQFSKLGELLDPLADRLYVIATLVAFVIRDIIPWWVAALIFARDIVLTVALPVLTRRGYPPYKVHYLGKAATFCLLYALPLLLWAQLDWWATPVVEPVAYAFTGWGVFLYLWAGWLYLRQVVWAARNAPVVPASQRPDVRSVAGG